MSASHCAQVRLGLAAKLPTLERLVFGADLHADVMGERLDARRFHSEVRSRAAWDTMRYRAAWDTVRYRAAWDAVPCRLRLPLLLRSGCALVGLRLRLW